MRYSTRSLIGALLFAIAACKLPTGSAPTGTITASPPSGEASLSQSLDVLLRMNNTSNDATGYTLSITRNNPADNKSFSGKAPLSYIVHFTGADDMHVSGTFSNAWGKTDAAPLEVVVTDAPVTPTPPPENTDLITVIQFNDGGNPPNVVESYKFGSRFTYYVQAQNNTNPNSSISFDSSKDGIEYILYKEKNPGTINTSADTKVIDIKPQANVIISLNKDDWFGFQQNNPNMTISGHAQISLNGVPLTNGSEDFSLTENNSPGYGFESTGTYYFQMILNYNISAQSKTFTTTSQPVDVTK